MNNAACATAANPRRPTPAIPAEPPERVAGSGLRGGLIEKFDGAGEGVDLGMEIGAVGGKYEEPTAICRTGDVGINPGDVGARPGDVGGSRGDVAGDAGGSRGDVAGDIPGDVGPCAEDVGATLGEVGVAGRGPKGGLT